MNKEARLEQLQRTVERLNQRIDSLSKPRDQSPENMKLLLSHEEQLRKTIESIAKEMGEFNEAPKLEQKPESKILSLAEKLYQSRDRDDRVANLAEG